MSISRAFTSGVLATVAILSFAAPGAWAARSMEATDLIATHRRAAAEAQQKVAYHEEMGRKNPALFGKFDMAGHCRFWADYYRKLAAKEEAAAKELEQQMP